jgi:para-aminobenzoate synthetase / 4-amino-4-deoxychorismate lyase
MKPRHAFTARFDSFYPDRSSRSFQLTRLVRVLRAETAEAVPALLETVSRAAERGLHVAGYLMYEAAPAFGTELRVHEPDDSFLPLAAFGVFAGREELGPPLGDAHGWELGQWAPSIARERYHSAIGEIRERIAAGETYQVNYTLRLRAPFTGRVDSLYTELCRSQRAPHCSLLRLGGRAIVSASPELFFRWERGRLELRPMKGTRPRGRWREEDERLAAELVSSPKERAENLMIVDLLRNDAGRIGRFGSVRVHSLWELETYPTVHQLTSTIVASTAEHVTLDGVFRALFPCGSVTGAPKVSTMGVIRELEECPRRVYTGAIGYVSGGEARFSVAIRTLEIDEHRGTAELGVGSGITWDSAAEAEYAECLAKSAFVRRPPAFELLETMLAEDGSVFLLDDHMDRLLWSADRLGFAVPETEIRESLRAAASASLGGDPRRLRLRVTAGGGFSLEAHEIGAGPGLPLRVAISPDPVDSGDSLLYHKTTARQPYDRRRATRPECDDVLLVNELGELTEATLANLVVVLAGKHFTPPISAGLLPGTFRAKLLREGNLRERTLRPQELAEAQAVYLINSVRRWQPAIVVQ